MENNTNSTQTSTEKNNSFNSSDKAKNTKNKIGKAEAIANFFKEKSSSVVFFLGNRFEIVKKEIEIIKEKSKNLLQTNYHLGLKHLENGNIADATFRFKFIQKFWPHHFDTHYQLAYCYFLQNRFARSKKILEDLINLDPNSKDKAQQLIDKINSKQAIDNN
ncbi:MAG: tetratricopeptide repeat protein [Alphaproteobacteria bacterium]